MTDGQQFPQTTGVVTRGESQAAERLAAASAGTQANAAANSDSGSTIWDWLRWAAALAVAIAAAYYFLDATAAKVICSDVVAGSEDSPRVLQTCGPPRLLELAPFALVISLLLWPDLSEIGVTGALSLKRRVDRQEERQEQLENRLIELHQSIMQTAAAVQGQSQAATTNVYNGYAPDQDDLSRGIRIKSQGSEGEKPVEGDAISAQLLGQFLSEYARLEPYVVSSQIRRSPALGAERLAGLSEEQMGIVDQWRSVFQDEIQAVRQTRNVAVHDPQSLSQNSLKQAIENTRELRRILFESLGMDRP